ncbi:MAG: glycosyltransferase family 4 protein [Candidatus Dormibacteria bacterium]
MPSFTARLSGRPELDLLFSLTYQWPEVRRGSERLVSDLGRVLGARGHRVTVVSGTRGRGRREAPAPGVRSALVPFTRARLAGLSELESGATRALVAGLARNAEVCHAFYPSDGYGFHLATRLRRRPHVVSWLGMPDREWWEAHEPRTHGWFLRSLETAGAITVMSAAAADVMAQQYGRLPLVLPPGVDTADFRRPRARPGPPVILCADAIDDPRKRIDTLLAAFAVLAAEDREVRLLLVGDGDPRVLRERVAGLRAGRLEGVTIARSDDVAAACAGAAVGVLTGEREVFGLVTLEFLAAGIPAVVPETAGSRMLVPAGAGLAYDPTDVAGCAAALRDALKLAADPATEDRCRAAAAPHDWSLRLGDYERLYEGLG